MEELLGLLLEIFGEFLLELFVSFISRFLREVFDTEEYGNPVLASLGFGIFGAVAGAISLLLWPHPLVRSPALHGISLLISPTATGGLMALVGFTLRHKGKEPTRIESFTCGFAFAFGLSLIRLIFVH
jgi:hypothetical protein